MYYDFISFGYENKITKITLLHTFFDRGFRNIILILTMVIRCTHFFIRQTKCFSRKYFKYFVNIIRTDFNARFNAK